MKQLVIGILAHVDAGKTTLSEALLYTAGAIPALGRVDHRDAYLDTHALERDRGITIFSKQALFQTPELAVTLLDTPGHVDFSAEMERTLQVLDYAILVISATDGVQAHTETLWRLLRRNQIPTFLFVTKMDLPNPGREAILAGLQRQLDEGCADFTRRDGAWAIDHPKDFKGHSLSVSDVVVLHQNGQDTAHYVDSVGFRQVPEFLQEQKQLTPDELTTGETIQTPRGTFHVTAMSREQIEAAGYGFHHQSDDGKYLIMGNGTRAFAVAAEQPEKANPLKHIEDTVEQNDNNFDGIINNTPTVDELEAKVKAGETISLVDLANAVKADKERGKEAKPEKKPSIRAQLRADKEKAQKKNAKQKLQDLERS